MNEAGVRQWSRSRYPLSGTPQKMSQAPPQMDVRPGETRRSASVQPSSLPQNVDTSIGAHQSVTMTESGHSPSASNLDNGTSVSSHGLTQEPSTPMEWSTTGSESQKPSLPTTTGNVYQLPLDGVDKAGFSPRSQYHDDVHATNRLTSLTQSTNPMPAMAGSLNDTNVPTASTGEESNASALQLQSPDDNIVMKRTLRRTPQSRSLREVDYQYQEPSSPLPGSTQLAQEGVSAIDLSKPADDEKVDKLLQNDWKRPAYHMQSIMGGSSMQRTNQNLSLGQSGPLEKAVSDQNAKAQANPVDRVSAQGQLFPMRPLVHEQAQSSPPVERPVYETELTNGTSSHPALESVLTTEESMLRHGTGYPVQTTPTISKSAVTPETMLSSVSENGVGKFSNISKSQYSDYIPELSIPGAFPSQEPSTKTHLERASAPRPTWNAKQEKQRNHIVTSTQVESKVPANVHSLRRMSYPLQSPASVQDLRGSTRSQTSNAEGNSVLGNGQASANLKPCTSPSVVRTPRRLAYPLQSPASVADLRNSTKPISSATEATFRQNSSQPLDDTQFDTSSSNGNHVFHRQMYPLQSMSYKAGKKLPHNPPAVAEESTPGEELREPWNSNDGGQGAIHKRSPVRQQVYPLQTQASIPTLRLPASPPPSPPLEREMHGKLPPSDLLPREREIASNVIKHWRRLVYPLQSPENVSNFHRAPTPQPPEPENDRNRYPEPIHLPKNLKAIPDAGKPGPRGRTIVVCLDGTGDKFDGDNSNIVHLISALKKDDPNQVTY